MKEQMISRVCAMLSQTMDAEQLREVRRCMSMVLTEYDVTVSETALIPYDGAIPEAVNVFLASKKIEGKSENTIVQYRMYLNEFFGTIQKQLRDINGIDVRVYLMKIQEERGIGNQSLEQRRVIVNHFFGWCVDNSYLDKNPAASIQPIKCEKKERHPLTENELEMLRMAADNQRDRALVEFFYSTGCRVSEVAELNRQDVDLTTGEMTVHGKGNKYRTVYLNARAKLTLFSYLNSRTDDDKALFASLRQPYGRLGKAAIERIIRNIGIKAGIERRVFPHLIRHTTATLALQRGMPVTEIQKMLGHSNINTTMTYAKQDKESVRIGHQKYVV